MLELVEYLAKSLVDDPSCVRVSQRKRAMALSSSSVSQKAIWEK